MASSMFGEQWFSRSSVPLELEKHVSRDGVSSKGRRAFYKNGEDLRLKEPGFNWPLICERRRKLVEDFSVQLTNIFDQFFVKITGDRPPRRSSIVPILPSTKTPGHSNHMSKIAHIPEKESSPVIIDIAPKKTKTRGSRKNAPVKNMEEVADDKRSVRRSTRLQTQQPKTVTIAEPPATVRTRRTRASNTEEAQKKSVNQKMEESTKHEPLMLRSSIVGIDSDDLIQIKDNHLSRKLSLSRTSSGSICRVSIDKLPIRLSKSHTPVPSDPATVVLSEGEDEIPEKQTDAVLSKNELKSQSATDMDTESMSNLLTLEKSDCVKSTGSSLLPHQPTPSKESQPGDDDVELSLAKPTPPRRKALKLRKKGGKKGGAGRPRTRAAELREQSSTAEEVAVDGQASSKATVPALPQFPAHHLSPATSTETLYQSCVSNLTPSPSIANNTTPQLPSRDTETDNDVTPIPAAPPVVSAPSYLTGTPRTLLKLREEYQSRNGGKLVSLTELLNSGGRSGSPLKKGSKIPKTPQKMAVHSPANQTASKTHSVPSDPHKTPLLVNTYASARNLPDTPAPLPNVDDVAEPADPMENGGQVCEEDVEADGLLLGKRMLRSGYMEKSAGEEWNGGGRKRTCSSENSESSQETLGGDSGEDGTGTDGSNSGTESNLRQNQTRSYTFLSESHHTPMEGVVYKAGTNQLLSFIPQKSPVKEKKAQLADKLHRKNKEGKKRQEDLKTRRQQEMIEKIKKREERVRRVAEKQAALRQKEEEKKQKIKGQQSQDPSKKVTIKKAKEIEEKNKKLKERMMAAEARRKQEEEQQKKRLQQLEDERRMVTELATKRKEMEEEEKRIKRREKLKQDRDRYLKRVEEQQEELKRKREEEVQKQQVAETLMARTAENAPSKHSEILKQFEKLLGVTAAKVPVVMTPKISHVIKSGEKSGNSSSSEKTNKLLQAYYSSTQMPPPTALSPADSRLNSTFTKEPGTPALVKAPPISYEMTPAENDPLYGYENYDIANLSASDSTDDDEDPKKELPMWAHPDALNAMMQSQEDDMNRNRVDIAKIFPPEQLLRDPNLGKIFRRKRQRFYQRTSSAHWNSPILKKNRIV
ncbi:inner centromere protein-like isoform X2 [Halichondria panicea]|uniref:inner centromere protein-like isoform X2 n=1 Tax=Halichondria panicea TaxID=6063 RepID=UPI00312B86DE